MAMDTMPSALDMAFRTALILTGAMKTAEAALQSTVSPLNFGASFCSSRSSGTACSSNSGGLLFRGLRGTSRDFRHRIRGCGVCGVDRTSPPLFSKSLTDPILAFIDDNGLRG